jgi:pimeloyl-ACP methyl ester carboxylesterase
MVDLQALERTGRHIDTPDGRVFVSSRGSDDGGAAPLVVLHGFPTSCHDFAPCIELLAARRRVLTFDFLGFGLSDKPVDHAYSLHEHTDVALAVLKSAGIARAHIWAHDMGTSVATELCARRERGLLSGFEVVSLTLMNGSVHVELAQLTIGQRILRSKLGPAFARLSTPSSFKRQIRSVFAQPVADSVVEEMWALLARADGVARLPALIGYVSERYRFWHRWVGALKRLDVPTLIAWGERDPVAVMAIARTLASEIPGARLTTWAELGHYPQVEDPRRVAQTIGDFLAQVDASAR